jgi:hypothetical protein
VTKTTQKHKHMKDGVVEFYVFDAVNNGAGGIGNTTGK